MNFAEVRWDLAPNQWPLKFEKKNILITQHTTQGTQKLLKRTLCLFFL